MVLQDNESSQYNSKPATSDAKKLADKHMADPKHVITDEDLKSIRVGVVSEPDAPTKQAVLEREDRVADHKADSEDEATPGAQKTTPWDVVE